MIYKARDGLHTFGGKRTAGLLSEKVGLLIDVCVSHTRLHMRPAARETMRSGYRLV